MHVFLNYHNYMISFQSSAALQLLLPIIKRRMTLNGDGDGAVVVVRDDVARNPRQNASDGRW